MYKGLLYLRIVYKSYETLISRVIMNNLKLILLLYQNIQKA